MLLQRYIPSRGKNDDAQTKSSYYIESAFTTSLSCFFMWPQYLVKRALRRQTNLKNKEKIFQHRWRPREIFKSCCYVVHYQNSERIQKHFRISRFCEIFFCCYIAQKLRAIVKRSSVAEFGKCKKRRRRVFFTALHNNEDYDGLKLRRNRNKIATSALFYGEGGE